MFLKTNIPETTGSLAGALVGFGDIHRPLDSLILNDRVDKTQEKIPGNRCGHDPQVPREYLRPEDHKPRPFVLEETIKALRAVYRLPKKFLKNLGFLNPKNRRKRSERREAIVSVSQVFVHYLEMITLKVGFKTASGTFVSLDLEYIAAIAGVAVIRAKRAIQDLVKAGYIKLSKQAARKDNGSFIALPSVREISPSFFADLGIDLQRLYFAREWKRKKEEKANAKQARHKLKGIIQAASAFSSGASLSGLGKKANNALASVFSTFSMKAKKVHTPAMDKALVNQALALHKENPERPPSEYLKELLRKNE